MISNLILQSIARIGGIATLVVAAAGFFFGPLWALAVLTGGAWMFVNFYFLFRLLDLGFASSMGVAGSVSPRTRDRIVVMSLLKFPVIYLAGFFILKSRFFPVSGLVTGLTLFFVALLISWGNFYRGLFGASSKRA